MRIRDQAIQRVGLVSSYSWSLEFRVKSRVGFAFLFHKDLRAGVGFLLLGKHLQGTETISLAGL